MSIMKRLITCLRLFVLLLVLGCGCFQPVFAAEKVILALGDSLTAGYGLAPEDSFPRQLESALRNRGHELRVMNAGISGDTSAGGLARLEWSLADQPDLVIVELGANDALRGLDPALTRRNLSEILRRLNQSGIVTLLTGMKAPRNLGPEYYNKFDALYPELAQQHGVLFYPFFLEGVAARPEFNQADGMHPNAEGVTRIVEGLLPLVEQGLTTVPNS